jgi:predicted metalloendopeptidase
MRSLATLLIGSGITFAAACGGESPQPVPPPAPIATTPPVSTADTAKNETVIKAKPDASLVDPSVSPCDDFFQYACGTWIKNTEIPADEASWYRSFSVIRDRNEEILKGILEAFAKGDDKSEPYAKQLGDYYGACMDEAGIEKAGTKPLAPWIRLIDGMGSNADLGRVLGKLQADGLGVLFDFGSAQDFNDANAVIGMIWQGGLGMPERDYYLDSSPKMTELRGKYETHVAATLKLSGMKDDKAAAAAKRILEIETDIAKAWMTKEDRREPKKINHRATKAELSKMVPDFPWDQWIDAAQAKSVAAYNVSQPDTIEAMGKMVKGGVKIDDWKAYLKWQLFRSASDELPKAFVDEKFKWTKELKGTKDLPPRWKRCVRAVDGGMGEALGQTFVKKTLGGEGKEKTVAIIREIEATMHGNLEHLAWMDDPTRKAAFTKLGKVANKVAYPEKWRSYEGIGVDRTSYVVDTIKASAFEYKHQLSKIGKPVDRQEWQFSPPTVNAFYDPQMNEMVFPAGILQPPFYANAASSATNFGGIGMVMGHELTHGFDDEGRQFDAEGNLKDWWSEKVNAEFERRAGCVKSQFDGYVELGDLHVNGKLTLGENIADLGGVKLSFRAMKAKAGSDPAAEQEFFLGFAQSWCSKMRDEALRTQIMTNPHSPAHLRVNGPLSNLPEFAQAFGCNANSKMVRKDRCEVW